MSQTNQQPKRKKKKKKRLNRKLCCAKANTDMNKLKETHTTKINTKHHTKQDQASKNRPPTSRKTKMNQINQQSTTTTNQQPKKEADEEKAKQKTVLR